MFQNAFFILYHNEYNVLLTDHNQADGKLGCDVEMAIGKLHVVF